MSTVSASITRALKTAMDERGETVSSIARKMGVSRQSVWQSLDEKKPRNFTIGSVERMADILGLKFTVTLEPSSKTATP